MLVGETKLGYKITELVGQGGFGTVYKAIKKNKAMETVRALKHISLPSRKQWTDIYNSMGNDMARTDAYFDTILQEILNEIRILADLTNKGVKNVVWYYENEIEDTPSPKHYDIYLLMEFLTSLPSYIETHEIKMKDVIKIGTDILTALIECHKSKIIHRDIKTDNIFVAEDGAYKLGDFGVSKKLSDRSRATSMKGTPNFIAPEVYLGQAYDETVDLYSLGIVLYRLLNYNRNPFMPNYPDSYNSEDEDKSFELRMKGDVPNYPAFAAGPLGDVILKSIADKDNRFKSAAEFKEALQTVESQMTSEELETVVLENVLSGVDFSTFGSNKNDLTQMANNEQANASNNSQRSFSQQNNSFASNNSQSFSQQNNSYSYNNVSQQAPKSNKLKVIIPIVAAGIAVTVGGLFFALKGGKSSGPAKNDWYVAPNGKEYYLDENGDPYKNTAKTINGETYFFNDEGEKVIDDWFDYNGDYYYIDANGKMLKDEFKNEGNNEWYYLGSDGKMIKDAFFDVKGETYYFDADGKMKADTLVLVNNALYYAQVDGAIKKNGWCVNNTYYADEEGKILMNTTTPDGVKVGSDGQRIKETEAYVPPRETSPIIRPVEPTPIGGGGGGTGKTSSFRLAATDKAGDDGNIIYSGSVDWGDHLRYNEKISLDEYGEDGSARITINIMKVRDDGSGEVAEMNRVIDDLFDDACDRAKTELPYKSFELTDTQLVTCNDNSVVVNYKGKIVFDAGDEKIQYKITLDRKNGSATYIKVR